MHCLGNMKKMYKLFSAPANGANSRLGIQKHEYWLKKQVKGKTFANLRHRRIYASLPSLKTQHNSNPTNRQKH